MLHNFSIFLYSCLFHNLHVNNFVISAVESLQNVMPGDCIVCFNKQDIYSVSRGLERLGKEAAVIYGSLPPNTKLAMSQRFNDPEVCDTI